MVTYDFPPIGGGGIQRNVKFLKYLNRIGWETNVLTVKERDFYVFDYTQLNEIKETTIYKSNSWDPVSLSYKVKNIFNKKNTLSSHQSEIKEGAWYVTIYRFIRNWFLLPDGYGGWIPFAYRKGKEVIKRNRPNILFCTFPIPSNAFVTYKLSKRFNIPFVLDFRDGWIDDPYTTFPSKLHLKFHKYYEKKIILSARQVIVYGEPLKIILENRYPILKNKIEVITNGFDPEDFKELTPVVRDKKNKKIRLVYSGSVYIDRRDTFAYFIEAVSLLSVETIQNLEIIFVGDKLKWATDLVESKNLNEIITFTGYLNHKDALNYLASADASLMFLKPGDVVALSGKIFEYIAIGNPIIACVEPNGACSKLLESINHSEGVCSPDKPYKIAEKLTILANGKMSKLNIDDKKKFSRKHHSDQLNGILNKLL